MRFIIDMEVRNEVVNYKQVIDAVSGMLERIDAGTNWNTQNAKPMIGDGGPITFNGIVIGNWKVEDSIHKKSL